MLDLSGEGVTLLKPKGLQNVFSTVLKPYMPNESATCDHKEKVYVLTKYKLKKNWNLNYLNPYFTYKSFRQ